MSEEVSEEDRELLDKDLSYHAERLKRKYPHKFKNFGKVNKYIHEQVDVSV